MLESPDLGDNIHKVRKWEDLWFSQKITSEPLVPHNVIHSELGANYVVLNILFWGVIWFKNHWEVPRQRHSQQQPEIKVFTIEALSLIISLSIDTKIIYISIYISIMGVGYRRALTLQTQSHKLGVIQHCHPSMKIYHAQHIR